MGEHCSQFLCLSTYPWPSPALHCRVAHLTREASPCVPGDLHSAEEEGDDGAESEENRAVRLERPASGEILGGGGGMRGKRMREEEDKGKEKEK